MAQTNIMSRNVSVLTNNIDRIPQIPLFRMLLYMFSQVLGAMAGQAIATFVILPEAGYSVFGPGAPLPLQDLSLVKVGDS